MNVLLSMNIYTEHKLFLRKAVGAGVVTPQSRQSAMLFLQSSGLGPPTPSHVDEYVPPPPLDPGLGEGKSRLRERGWGVPIPKK
jgi:hypothetical protein